MHVDRVAAAADDLAVLSQSSLFVDVVRIRVEILHALCHNNALGILPRSFSDAIAGVHASDASRFSSAQIGTPVCFGRARGFGERLTVCIRTGEATKVGAIALAHAGDEE